jgi:outer membrane protein assembly factor BamB
LRPIQPRRARSIGALASAVAAAAAVGWLAAPASAQQGEGWTQMGGDGAHAREAFGPSPAYRLAWHLDVELAGSTGRQGLSQPIVSGGVVIATAPEEVIGVDAASGEVVWTVERADGPPAPPAVVPGGAGGVLVFTEGWAGDPPAVAGSGATLGSTASPTPSPTPSPDAGGADEARLVGIDLATMEPAWPPVPLADLSRSGISADGSSVFVGDRSGTLLAVDATTGRVRWRAELGGGIDLTPTVGEDAVVVALRATRSSRAAVVALDPGTGERRWRAESSVQAPTAVTIADGVALVTGLDVTVEALDLDSGVATWRSRSPLGGPAEGGVAVADGTVVSLDRRGLVTAATLAGERVWDFAINRPVARGAPVVVGDSVLVPSEDGAVQAFDLESGDRRWRGVEGSGPARGIAVGEDVVVVLRAGASAGLDGWVTDPSAPLERVASPTRFDPAPALLAFAGAAVPLALVSFALARVARDRVVPPLADEADAPEDPLEPSEGPIR